MESWCQSNRILRRATPNYISQKALCMCLCVCVCDRSLTRESRTRWHSIMIIFQIGATMNEGVHFPLSD